MISNMMTHLDLLFFWGFIATCAMTTIMECSRYIGLSRLSMPFLVGTLFSGNRSHAELIGFLSYLVGGFLFAMFYAILFESLGVAGWWRGAFFGLLHGLFLLVVVLPLAHTVHPRIASPYDGPQAKRRIEPPGFMGFHYGNSTPIVTLIGLAVYGAILGAMYPA